MGLAMRGAAAAVLAASDATINKAKGRRTKRMRVPSLHRVPLWYTLSGVPTILIRPMAVTRPVGHLRASFDSRAAPRYSRAVATHIFTIGYEAATMADFIAALTSAGVRRVIDVRALPLSRRPGFSKTSLRGALAEAGIDYVHLRALGTPASGREAARKGRHEDLRRIYAGQLELPEAIAQGAQMVALAAEQPSALLCYEREPAGCHRSLLLEAVAPEAEVTHLFA